MTNAKLKKLTPLAILLGSGLLAAGLISQRSQARETAPPKKVPTVEVVEVKAFENSALIPGRGLVKPSRQVVILPQVTGLITKMSPSIQPGARLQKGEVIARIDSRDYSLALRQEESRLEKARLDLEVEEGRAAVAAHEWELLGRDKDDVKARLALRKPHLATSQSNLRSAESGVARAKLNLSRTALKAPFNSLVLKKSVDQGQLVSANTPVVTLIGTDVFWVDVMVPMEKLRFLDIPGLNAEQGSKATLLQKLPDGSFITRKGEILRLQGELDAATRQARLLVSIPSPLNNEGGALPLLPGAWVDVELHGKSMPESLGLPRTALREGSYVWTVTPSGTLEKRVVSIGWRGKEMLSISGGITAGDKVVTTLMSLPLEGMAVKATLGSTAHAEAAGSEQ